MSIALLAFVSALAGGAPQFVEKPCAAGTPAGIRCGSVLVPEDRTAPGGRTIPLNVVIVPALRAKADLPPLFDIEGGPGLPATKNAGFYLTAGSAYRARRPVVLVDQRGTGSSNPLLCPELSRREDAYRPMLPIDAVRECRARLEPRADLRRYGTLEATADLDAVRQALGYERIDIFALSYGTTVALRYMAHHPGRVRAAVLFGVAPPEARPPRYHAQAGQRALDHLFADCARDAGCAAAFPSPRSDFARARERLAGSAEPTPEVFAEKIRSLAYTAAGARKIPFIVSRAAAGDLEPFYEATRPGERLPYADGMFLSVTCSEGVALTDRDAASAEARATVFGDYRLRRQTAACGQWPVGAVAPDHLQPPQTDAAVLLVSGRLDPVTPPEWAADLAARLPNARHLVLRHGGHVLDGLTGVDTCFDPLVTAFYDSGDPRALDAGCLAKMAPPPFVTAPQ